MSWQTEIKILCDDLLVPYTVEDKAIAAGKTASNGNEYNRAYEIIRDYIHSNRF